MADERSSSDVSPMHHQGGSARFLAKTFGCHVTCMNLGTNQNNYNEEKAREEGLSHLITVVKVC